MKRPPHVSRSTKRRPTRPPSRRGVGEAIVRETKRREPTPGWKGELPSGWKNPRPPAVPATLDLRLNEYYTAATLMGLLAGQKSEPNKRWCRDWSIEMGDMVGTAVLRRRRQR